MASPEPPDGEMTPPEPHWLNFAQTEDESGAAAEGQTRARSKSISDNERHLWTRLSSLCLKKGSNRGDVQLLVEKEASRFTKYALGLKVGGLPAFFRDLDKDVRRLTVVYQRPEWSRRRRRRRHFYRPPDFVLLRTDPDGDALAAALAAATDYAFGSATNVRRIIGAFLATQLDGSPALAAALDLFNSGRRHPLSFGQWAENVRSPRSPIGEEALIGFAHMAQVCVHIHRRHGYTGTWTYRTVGDVTRRAVHVCETTVGMGDPHFDGLVPGSEWPSPPPFAVPEALLSLDDAAPDPPLCARCKLPDYAAMEKELEAAIADLKDGPHALEEKESARRLARFTALRDRVLDELNADAETFDDRDVSNLAAFISALGRGGEYKMVDEQDQPMMFSRPTLATLEKVADALSALSAADSGNDGAKGAMESDGAPKQSAAHSPAASPPPPPPPQKPSRTPSPSPPDTPSSSSSEAEEPLFSTRHFILMIYETDAMGVDPRGGCWSAWLPGPRFETLRSQLRRLCDAVSPFVRRVTSSHFGRTRNGDVLERPSVVFLRVDGAGLLRRLYNFHNSLADAVRNHTSTNPSSDPSSPDSSSQRLSAGADPLTVAKPPPGGEWFYARLSGLPPGTTGKAVLEALRNHGLAPISDDDEGKDIADGNDIVITGTDGTASFETTLAFRTAKDEQRLLTAFKPGADSRERWTATRVHPAAALDWYQLAQDAAPELQVPKLRGFRFDGKGYVNAYLKPTANPKGPPVKSFKSTSAIAQTKTQLQAACKDLHDQIQAFLASRKPSSSASPSSSPPTSAPPPSAPLAWPPPGNPANIMGPEGKLKSLAVMTTTLASYRNAAAKGPAAWASDPVGLPPGFKDDLLDAVRDAVERHSGSEAGLRLLAKTQPKGATSEALSTAEEQELYSDCLAAIGTYSGFITAAAAAFRPLPKDVMDMIKTAFAGGGSGLAVSFPDYVSDAPSEASRDANVEEAMETEAAEVQTAALGETELPLLAMPGDMEGPLAIVVPPPNVRGARDTPLASIRAKVIGASHLAFILGGGQMHNDIPGCSLIAEEGGWVRLLITRPDDSLRGPASLVVGNGYREDYAAFTVSIGDDEEEEAVPVHHICPNFLDTRDRELPAVQGWAGMGEGDFQLPIYVIHSCPVDPLTLTLLTAELRDAGLLREYSGFMIPPADAESPSPSPRTSGLTHARDALLNFLEGIQEMLRPPVSDPNAFPPPVLGLLNSRIAVARAQGLKLNDGVYNLRGRPDLVSAALFPATNGEVIQERYCKGDGCTTHFFKRLDPLFISDLTDATELLRQGAEWRSDEVETDEKCDYCSARLFSRSLDFLCAQPQLLVQAGLLNAGWTMADLSTGAVTALELQATLSNLLLLADLKIGQTEYELATLVLQSDHHTDHYKSFHRLENGSWALVDCRAKDPPRRIQATVKPAFCDAAMFSAANILRQGGYQPVQVLWVASRGPASDASGAESTATTASEDEGGRGLSSPVTLSIAQHKAASKVPGQLDEREHPSISHAIYQGQTPPPQPTQSAKAVRFSEHVKITDILENTSTYMVMLHRRDGKRLDKAFSFPEDESPEEEVYGEFEVVNSHPLFPMAWTVTVDDTRWEVDMPQDVEDGVARESIVAAGKVQTFVLTRLPHPLPPPHHEPSVTVHYSFRETEEELSDVTAEDLVQKRIGFVFAEKQTLFGLDVAKERGGSGDARTSAVQLAQEVGTHHVTSPSPAVLFPPQPPQRLPIPPATTISDAADYKSRGQALHNRTRKTAFLHLATAAANSGAGPAIAPQQPCDAAINTRLLIAVGVSLVSLDVDVIVNAANGLLQLEPASGVTAALRMADNGVGKLHATWLKAHVPVLPATPPYTKRGQMIKQEKLVAGASVISRCHLIPAKLCANVRAPDGRVPEEQRHAFDLLFRGVVSAMDQASAEGMTSIAFPLLGTGAFLSQPRSTASSLREARATLHDALFAGIRAGLAANPTMGMAVVSVLAAADVAEVLSRALVSFPLSPPSAVPLDGLAFFPPDLGSFPSPLAPVRLPVTFHAVGAVRIVFIIFASASACFQLSKASGVATPGEPRPRPTLLIPARAPPGQHTLHVRLRALKPNEDEATGLLLLQIPADPANREATSIITITERLLSRKRKSDEMASSEKPPSEDSEDEAE